MWYQQIGTDRADGGLKEGAQHGGVHFPHAPEETLDAVGHGGEQVESCHPAEVLAPQANDLLGTFAGNEHAHQRLSQQGNSRTNQQPITEFQTDPGSESGAPADGNPEMYAEGNNEYYPEDNQYYPEDDQYESANDYEPVDEEYYQNENSEEVQKTSLEEELDATKQLIEQNKNAFADLFGSGSSSRNSYKKEKQNIRQKKNKQKLKKN